jgi:hypothetical protein
MTDSIDGSVRRGGAFDVGVCTVFLGLVVFWVGIGLAIWHLV